MGGVSHVNAKIFIWEVCKDVGLVLGYVADFFGDLTNYVV